MDKIKIVFYSHTIDFAGTWRSHERILLNIDKEKFQPYVLYRSWADNNRLDILCDKIGKEYVIEFDASVEKLGANMGYPFMESNFVEKIKEISPDIIHFARSGYYEWPFVERICPIQMETNIFGSRDNSDFLDYSVTISNKVNQLRGGSDIMIYNPIPSSIEIDDLKKDLNIKDDYLVFGRIGRKDNYHPIALNALTKFKQRGYKFKYIIIGACNRALKDIDRLGLTEDCIIIETTNDDDYIHRFHKTIDIFLHYRSDGETFGTGIAQSMMYGNPIISHYGGFNAQSEIISDCGFVCNNDDEYLSHLIDLIENDDLYKKVSENALNRSKDFDEKNNSKKI
jgi:glycosyltransferase involved in cell wall biosynthesis